MVINPNFWPEITNYANDLSFAVSNNEITKEQMSRDTLVSSIGFMESLDYIKQIKECHNPLKYKQSKKITDRFLDQFKVRTRSYATYQFKSARSCNITKTGI